jgi:hypothetical protein
MSDPPLGRYHFLSWARRGIGASVGNPDNNGSLPSRASLSVQLSLQVQQGSATNTVQPTPMQVQMFGPGDIIGIDPRHIIRTEPRNFTVNFEPNYLCGIEFDTPDLPWLFTPAAPNGDHLRPWLALIALKPDEFKFPSLAPNPLPVVEVQKIGALQDLADSSNWAHVQVSGDGRLSDATASAPGTVISRLLCPRRLDPETHYTVFLVPAFEIGRQADLGQDVSGVATAEPAWTKQTHAPLPMPFYYQFEFNTSDEGDFESLVRRLTPRVLPAEVGERPMDVTTPAPHIRSAGGPLGLEGALHSVLTQPTPWNDPDKTNFQSDVQTFVNHAQAPTDDPANPNPDDPVIAPPIYGRWHAAVQSVDRTAPGWVNDLNLDSRNRSAAGMGTQAVQEERTQLMASAWQQVDGVRKANELLRQAQLARAALQQLHLHELQPALPETLMNVTAPLHPRLLASPKSVLATVRGSRVPERLLSGTFRRVTRPRRRVGASPNARAALLSRVNSGEVAIVPAPKPPGGMVSIEQVSDNFAPSWVQNLAKHWKWIVLALLLLLLLVVVVVGVFAGVVAVAAIIVVAAAVAAALWPTIKKLLQKAQAATDLTMSGFTPTVVTQAPPNPSFTVTIPGTPPVSGGAGPDSPQARAFRSATTDLFTSFQDFPVDPPLAPSLDLAGIKTTLLARLDPGITVPRRVQSLITFSARFSWLAPDLLEPIMAAPEFPQPMYAPLRDLSPDYVLPGVELVPPDTLGLLLSNHAFIEGYMVGLNHEMARQLLWNDYPTDQRGSYFRQFWDVSAYVPQAGDPSDPAKLRELLKDIPPIHTWPKPLALGEHPNRTDIVENNVVLLVRGELFKRYPNAIVYAGKAKRGADGTRVLDESDERYPIFRGTLPTDITFLGFNLSLDDARGGTPQSPEGFFFVFQQQPSEPRFGLEPNEDATPIAHWAELAWTSFEVVGDVAGGAGGGGEGGGGGGPVFKLPNLGNTARGKLIANSPWRLASQVFSLVLSNVQLPDFLSSKLKPVRVSIPPGGGNPALPDYSPDDPNNDWGVNSAQTAYILLRLPFRILIHADLMLPS